MREYDSEGQLAIKIVKRAAVAGALALVVVIVLLGGWYTVDAGERAIVLRMGAVSSVQDAGFHFKLPLVDRVKRIDVRVTKEVTKTEAGSKDLQIVNAEFALNYEPDITRLTELYSKYGQDREAWAARIIDPAIQEVFKDVASQYNAEQLITHRTEMSAKIATAIRGKVDPFGLTIVAINITDFDFSDVFNHAIEAKQVAEQQALQAKNVLEQVKTEAEQKIEKAKAEAESLRVQRAEVTPQILQLRAIEKWDGVLPTLMTGGGALPFLSIGDLASNTKLSAHTSARLRETSVPGQYMDANGRAVTASGEPIAKGLRKQQ